MNTKYSIAQVVLISSGLTLLILLSLGFIFRQVAVSYIQSHVGVPDTMTEVVFPPSTSQQIVTAVSRANDAVVSVVVTKDVPIYERYYESFNPWGFGSFAIPRIRENGTQEQEVGGGSGFLVSADGMIVTNRHVVSDPDARYSVLLNSGESHAVDVLAIDSQLDVAVLQITDSPEQQFPFVEFGDSQMLALGETVIAIGNALAEFRNSVSVGVVSGLARSIIASDSTGSGEQLDLVIQTDAAINPGNSGGPLLNLNGKVIGVNVATSRGADNIGFALPAVLVQQVVDSVREYGEIIRPYLGVRYAMIDAALAKENSLPVSYGALVIAGEAEDQPAVMADSPAAEAGIDENTIILAVDGEVLRNRDLATVLRGKAVGQTIELLLLQNEVEKTVSVTLQKAL